MKSRRILLLTFLLMAATTIGVNAQSQDRDNPTPLTTNTIKGNGIGKKVEYYYSFTAGPGEVVVTVDLKANAGSTNADVEVFDAESKIFYIYPNATTTNEHAVKKFTLTSEQPLILRLALDSSAGAYSIKLGGPIQIPTDPPTGNASASSTAEQPAPDPANTTPTDALSGTTAKSAKSSKLDFTVDLLQTAGKHFGLPTAGILHIVMKDGTTQDIDLSQVKTASVTKQ
jgi:hypothetical protein